MQRGIEYAPPSPQLLIEQLQENLQWYRQYQHDLGADIKKDVIDTLRADFQQITLAKGWEPYEATREARMLAVGIIPPIERTITTRADFENLLVPVDEQTRPPLKTRLAERLGSIALFRKDTVATYRGHKQTLMDKLAVAYQDTKYFWHHPRQQWELLTPRQKTDRIVGGVVLAAAGVGLWMMAAKHGMPSSGSSQNIAHGPLQPPHNHILMSETPHPNTSHTSHSIGSRRSNTQPTRSPHRTPTSRPNSAEPSQHHTSAPDTGNKAKHTVTHAVRTIRAKAGFTYWGYADHREHVTPDQLHGKTLRRVGKYVAKLMRLNHASEYDAEHIQIGEKILVTNP